MTQNELQNDFYRTLDACERKSETPDDVARVAVAMGLHTKDRDACAVLARVAFRLALRALHRAQRDAWRARPTARRRSRPDYQAAADAGRDTWEDYRGER